MFASCAPSLDNFEMPLDHEQDFGYQTIAVDDENEGFMGGYSSSYRQGHAHSRPQSAPSSFKEKMSALKRQASAKIDKLLEASPRQLPTSQNVLENDIIQMTDPLRTSLDLERATNFLDDLRSWAVADKLIVSDAVKFLCKRLQSSDPHTTCLALELLDFLMKNTGSMFHGAVASQPMMSIVAGIARGSNPTPTKMFVDKFHAAQEKLGAVKDRVKAELSGRSDELDRDRTENGRRREQIMFKARELVFTWAEGFEQYEYRFPLFAQTYQTLINEGLDFNDVTLRPPAMLETPSSIKNLDHGGHGGHGSLVAVVDEDADHSSLSFEDEAMAYAIRASMQDANVQPPAAPAHSADFIGRAHESARMLTEAKRRGHAQEAEALACEAAEQQREAAAAVEAAMGAADDELLMGALAANEALQQALQMSIVQQEEEQEQQEEEEAAASTEGIDDIIEYLNEHVAEEEQKEEQKPVDIQEHFLALDFNDQGKFSKDGEKEEQQEQEEANLENTKTPDTTPILPDL